VIHPSFTRYVLLRGVAVVAVAAIGSFWLVVSTLHGVSEQKDAQRILKVVLREPTEAALRDALAVPGGPTVEVAKDLVYFKVSRAEAESRRTQTINRIINARAAELYTKGMIRDPGSSRTQVGISRRMLEQLTATRHDRLGTTATIAMWAAVGGLVLCGLLGWGGFSFGGPGLAAALSWMFARGFFWLVDIWFSRTSRAADVFKSQLGIDANANLRRTLLLALALLVAAIVYGRLRIRFAQQGLAPEETMSVPRPGEITTADRPAAPIAVTVPTAPSRRERIPAFARRFPGAVPQARRGRSDEPVPSSGRKRFPD
jgi:hypothetical protein